MPIIKKNGTEIFFFHIPRCGGTSIYWHLAQNGWSIIGLDKTSNPHGTLCKLGSKHPLSVYQNRKISRFWPYPQQHLVPAFAPITTKSGLKFSIVRDPVDRFLSACAFCYKENAETKSYLHFISALVHRFELCPLRKYLGYAGHFIPQKYFLTSETRIFPMTDFGLKELSRWLDLRNNLPYQNRSVEALRKINENAKEMLGRRINLIYKDDKALYQESLRTFQDQEEGQ